MKKILTTVLALAMICTMLFTLASCAAKPSGKYGDKLGLVTLTFDGSKVTVNALGFKSTGTFKMGDEGAILIEYEDDEDTKSAPTGLVYDADADTVDLKLGSASYSLEKKD